MTVKYPKNSIIKTDKDNFNITNRVNINNEASKHMEQLKSVQRYQGLLY